MQISKTTYRVLSVCYFAFALNSCQEKSLAGRRFIVSYTWNSQLHLVQVVDAASGKEVDDAKVLMKISENAAQQLPPWIALSRLQRAKGAFHIEFYQGNQATILETAHGLEGAGSEFIKDPDVTDLMISAHLGRLDTAQRLLARGEDVNATDQFGNTALIAAISSGRLDLVRLLIDHKADTNLRNKDGDSALTLSISSGRTELAAELASKGDHLDCKNPNDRAIAERVRKGEIKLPRHVKILAKNCKNLEN